MVWCVCRVRLAASSGQSRRLESRPLRRGAPPVATAQAEARSMQPGRLLRNCSTHAPSGSGCGTSDWDRTSNCRHRCRHVVCHHCRLSSLSSVITCRLSSHHCRQPPTRRMESGKRIRHDLHNLSALGGTRTPNLLICTLLGLSAVLLSEDAGRCRADRVESDAAARSRPVSRCLKERSQYPTRHSVGTCHGSKRVEVSAAKPPGGTTMISLVVAPFCCIGSHARLRVKETAMATEGADR
jgi:hypothetical protein